MILKREVVSQLLDVACFSEHAHATLPLLLSTKSERVEFKKKNNKKLDLNLATGVVLVSPKKKGTGCSKHNSPIRN